MPLAEITQLCERGNILLVNTESSAMAAWLRVPGTAQHWLSVSFHPDNYPALYVSAVELADDALALQIAKAFGDDTSWVARKMNLDGVQLDDEEHVRISTALINTWGAAECLDYIREHGLDYDEPEETAEVDLDEVRRLCIESRERPETQMDGRQISQSDPQDRHDA